MSRTAKTLAAAIGLWGLTFHAPPAGAAPPDAVTAPDEPMPDEIDEPLPTSEPAPATAPAATGVPTAALSGSPAPVAPSSAAPVPVYELEASRRPSAATPSLLVSWRLLNAPAIGAPPGPGLSGGLRFNAFAGEYYPVSRTLRVGLEPAVGFAGSDSAGAHGEFFLSQSGSVGVQWPRRVTPYVDLIAGVGVLRRSLFNQDVFTLMYSTGAEVGLAALVSTRLTMAGSIGWERPVFRVAAGPGHVDVYSDSLTLRLAIGF